MNSKLLQHYAKSAASWKPDTWLASHKSWLKKNTTTKLKLNFTCLLMCSRKLRAIYMLSQIWNTIFRPLQQISCFLTACTRRTPRDAQMKAFSLCYCTQGALKLL